MMLKGRVAIVTGASRGIGKATALALAREGADIIGVSQKGAEETVKEIRTLGRRAISIGTDVSNRVEVAKMVEKTIEAFGKIDILVNNAAIYTSTSLEDISEQEWRRMLDVNLKGTFLCSQCVIKFMQSQGYGRIINVASSSAVTGGTANVGVHYAASKAGVLGLTKSMAKQLSPYGINVNAVMPGIIETSVLKDWSIEFRKSIMNHIPLRRFGKPEEVAEAVVFLASDMATYITGATIVVSGGLAMI